jgi:ribosome-binding factor A
VTRKKRTQRLRRVDEVLRQVVSDSLLGMSDPRLRSVVITGVEASADVAYADVYVQITGNEHRREKVLEALERARPGIQSRINAEMRLRLTPVLRFSIDETFDRALRIEELLSKHQPLPVPPEVPGADVPEADA